MYTAWLLILQYIELHNIRHFKIIIIYNIGIYIYIERLNTKVLIRYDWSIKFKLTINLIICICNPTYKIV